MRHSILLLFPLWLALCACDRSSPDGAARDGNGLEQAGTVSAVVQGDATATPRPTRPSEAGTTILVEGLLAAVKPVAALSFTTGGRLKSIDVEEGDVLSAGALIAMLDDEALQKNVTSAQLQVAQAENGLAQAQLTLDELREWQPDELAVALAEANLLSAEAGLEAAESRDAAAANNLTSVRIRLEQAERTVSDSRKAYDTAFDPGRDWELYMNEPSCLPGQGGAIPCTGVPLRLRLESERAATEAGVERAAENLAIAQADYRLAVSSLNENSAVQARAAVIGAEQALAQAKSGPRETEISAAALRVEQASLALDQAQFNLEQAYSALEELQLKAPWAGTVLTVDASPGIMVGSGLPIITLMDAKDLRFHTSNLSERDLSQVQPGQRVQVTLKAYPGRPIEGTVSYFLPRASGSVGDAATFTVVVSLSESELLLLAGMTGRAEMYGKSE